MTRKDEAKCKANAIWYVRQLLAWRIDFFARLSKEGAKPSRKSAAEFQALRRATWYYLDQLIEYAPVRRG